jgi:RNA polymerase sigma factor (sigma-70 family)
MGVDRREARETLVSLYPALRRFAAAVCPAEEDPDDYVQEAFVGALLRRDLDGYQHLGAYLRRSIVNLAASRRRGLARRRLALLRLRAAAADPPRDRYPSDVADLWRVDSTARAILYLVDVEGWHYGQVAGMVGLSEEAARTRASRGRRRLSAALTEETTP